MNKNIRTHEAKIDLVKKFLDYANIADASYASLKYALYLIFGILIVLLLNGCSLISFKSIDPQYYKFKRLCKNVDSEVTIYNQDYFDIIKNHKNIKTNDKGCFYSEKLEQEICFGGFAYSKSNRVVIEYNKFGLKKSIQKRYYNDIHYLDYTLYVYTYYGLFLRGDEGRGWHWETEDSLECSIMDNY